MNKKRKIIFFLTLTLLSSCSFDDRTGIWDGNEVAKERIIELEKEQDSDKFVNIFLSEEVYKKEITLTKKIILSNPKKNLSWEKPGLNNQNLLGNIYLSGVDNIFLKKKIGKNKFSAVSVISSPIVYKNNIIFADNNGTIFSVNLAGKINWKKNIYKKIFKKVYKNLVFNINKNNIYIADNIGFIYSINLENGKLNWIKNHGIPLKSNIKVFENKIFLINQDNRIFCLNTEDGSKFWDVRSIESFIKLQNFLPSGLLNNGNLLVINSSGELLKIDSKSGRIFWSLNTLGAILMHDTDFFSSSEIVISDNNAFFSVKSSFFSVNLDTGYVNWRQKVSSVATPIIDKENIFILTSNGYFVILDKNTGKIISSKNILKVLKKNKQNTKVAGFIMGSGKIYSTTSNGYLVIISPISGNAEYFKKIGDPIIASPVISDGKLYILTKNSRIIGFN